MKHTNFFSALKVAVIGILGLFSESRNARIQFVIFSLVIAAGLVLELNRFEWLSLLIASTIVLALEAVNTSIELLADVYTLDFHPKIKQVKDIAAGAVLIASMFALIIGIIIFLPHLSAMIPL